MNLLFSSGFNSNEPFVAFQLIFQIKEYTIIMIDYGLFLEKYSANSKKHRNIYTRIKNDCISPLFLYSRIQ